VTFLAIMNSHVINVGFIVTTQGVLDSSTNRHECSKTFQKRV